MQYTLLIANQQTGIMTVVELVIDVIPTALVDGSAPPKEVNNDMEFLFIKVNDDINEVEEDEGDEQGEWNDGNETDEE